MGIYLETNNLDDWLEANATEVSIHNWTEAKRPRFLTPLCEFLEPRRCVLIAHTEAEMQRALPRPSDQRRRRYFFASTQDIHDELDRGLVKAIKQDIEQGLSGPSTLMIRKGGQ